MRQNRLNEEVQDVNSSNVSKNSDQSFLQSHVSGGSYGMIIIGCVAFTKDEGSLPHQPLYQD